MVIRALLLVVLLIGTQAAKAQFAYAGLSLGYSRLEAGRKTAVSGLDVIPQILYRPIRNVGVGLQCMLPISQGNTFSFNGSPTSSGYFGGWRDDGRNANYKPQVYDYTIERSAQLGLVLRYFLESRANVYFDLRYTHGRVMEEFVLTRPYSGPVFYFGSIEYPAIPAKDLYYQRTMTLGYPGMSFGIMPPISDRFFIKADVNVDLLLFRENGFSHRVEYRDIYFSDRHEYVTFESPLNTTKLAWSFGLGTGIFF